METGGREAMVNAYVAVASRSWTDPGFKQRLADAPRAALAEQGFMVPDDTDVQVAFVDPAEAPAPARPADEVAADWEEQLAHGRLHLVIADQPKPIATTELSDEDLKVVVGGIAILPYGT
jgi:hypothetical protein